jgi:hypothetical protein
VRDRRLLTLVVATIVPAGCGGGGFLQCKVDGHVLTAPFTLTVN